MSSDARGFEQIPDEQRALDLYLLAEKQLYESPLGAPPDPAYLQVMVAALQTRQLCRLNALREALTQRESTPHE